MCNARRSIGAPANSSAKALFRKRLSLGQERGEPRLLIGNPVCGKRFGRGTGYGSGLFGQVADILTECSNARVEFGKSREVGHGTHPFNLGSVLRASVAFPGDRVETVPAVELAGPLPRPMSQVDPKQGSKPWAGSCSSSC